MDEDQVLYVLSTSPRKESTSRKALRHAANDLISNNSPRAQNMDKLPGTLLDLLSQIIKPMFTATKHPSLTSTGRKNLVALPPASLGPQFVAFENDDDDDEDEGGSKAWKSPFTAPVLEYVLSSYSILSPPTHRKTTIEAHFHLLVPPLLNMIDDADVRYKARGCALLARLCGVLTGVQSDMLLRTGLGEVFVDALKANFMLLPTLTPEEDSLAVLRASYPAYLALVDATYMPAPTPTPTPTATPISASKPISTTTPSSTTLRNATTTVTPSNPSLTTLTVLYRHGILASLTHLSSSSILSSTISAPLTTFLLTQIPPIFRRLGVSSVRHLQTLLPLLRASLMDPFTLAAPGMVLAVFDVLEVVVEVCRERVRERWALEILRGLVGCWCNCLDELDPGTGTKSGSRGRDATSERGSDIKSVLQRAKDLVRSLSDVVDEQDWHAVREELVQEEPDLKKLFE